MKCYIIMFSEYKDAADIRYGRYRSKVDHWRSLFGFDDGNLSRSSFVFLYVSGSVFNMVTVSSREAFEIVQVSVWV